MKAQGMAIQSCTGHNGCESRETDQAGRVFIETAAPLYVNRAQGAQSLIGAKYFLGIQSSRGLTLKS